MTVAAGPFAIASVLLAVGGALKAYRPGDTAIALRAVGLPGRPGVVRVGGVIEAAVGAAALVTGSRVSAILVAVSYAAFLGFVVEALRRHTPIASCGCFGKADTPPSRAHVAVNLAALASAVAVAVSPGVGLVHTLGSQPLAGVPYAILVSVGVGLAFVALSSLARTLALVPASRGRS